MQKLTNKEEEIMQILWKLALIRFDTIIPPKVIKTSGSNSLKSESSKGVIKLSMLLIKLG